MDVWMYGKTTIQPGSVLCFVLIVVYMSGLMGIFLCGFMVIHKAGNVDTHPS